MKRLLILLLALISATAFAGLQTSVYDVPGNAGTASTLAAGASVSNLVIRTSGAGAALTIDTNIVFTNGMVGIGTTNPLAALDLVGSSATFSAPDVTPQGTIGTTTWSYKVAALLTTGQRVLSATGTTATGNAALSDVNFNAVSWAAYPGAVGYILYRTTSGGTPSDTGLIMSALYGESSTTINDEGYPAAVNVNTLTRSLMGNVQADILRVGNYTDAEKEVSVGVEGDMSVHGSVRSTGVDSLETGSGTELQFVAGTGLVLAFNRDSTQFLPLSLNYGGTKDVGPVLVGSTTGDLSGIFQVSGAAGIPAASGTNQNGIVRIKTSGTTSLDIGISSNSPFAPWLQGGTRSALETNSPILLNPNGGNIGINNTTADKALTLGPDAVIGWDYNGGYGSSTHTISGGRLNPIAFQVAAFSADSPIFTFSGNNSVPRLLIKNGGNVGIGTTNPASTLEVVGTLAVIGTVTVEGSVGIATTWTNVCPGVSTNVVVTVGGIVVSNILISY